jgi:L-lactate dehydrogenase complex protein LldE
MERVQLFATCLGDLVLPGAVADAESLLRAAGYEVDFPAGQVCCGQPAFNSGHRPPPVVLRAPSQGLLA